MRQISQVGACSKDRPMPSHFGGAAPYLRFVAMQFEKWEGTGNDFVLVDGRQPGRLPSDWSDAEVRALCDREQGIGSDGVVVVKPQENGLDVDFRNPDGSRSFCGNGTRCAFAWAHDAGLIKSKATLEAFDGVHRGQIRQDGTPGISLNVQASLEQRSPMITGSSHAAFLDTGSPHHVEFLSDDEALQRLNLDAVAHPVRHHEFYQPGGCNVNVVAPLSNGLSIRTFERGVEAETLSCGTGIVAAALADVSRSGGMPGKHQRSVQAKGGILEVHASLNAAGRFEQVWLFGAVRRVFRGMWCVVATMLALCGDVAWGGDLVNMLGEDARISVLTASPGDDLYAAFGHTAIRVFDPGTRLDLVFNYGTFVVDEGFYVRFVRGRMDYRLDVQQFGRFQSPYLRQGRALHEQVLNLSQEDVRSLVTYLEWNAQPENQVYAYDFFRDNCATKIIAVLGAVFGDRFDAHCLPSDSTYLEALRPYTAGHPWSAFGMELILGAEASSPMPSCGHSFLPDVLSRQLGVMTLDGEPLAFPMEVIFPNEGNWQSGIPRGDKGRAAPPVFTWGWAVWMIFVLWLCGKDASAFRWGTRLSIWATGLAAALLAILFLLMAAVTDHNDTWWNADLVWALGGFGMCWMAMRKRRGARSEDLVWERRLAMVWTILAIFSVFVVPFFRSNLSWVETLVWPTIGACISVICAVWCMLRRPD